MKKNIWIFLAIVALIAVVFCFYNCPISSRHSEYKTSAFIEGEMPLSWSEYYGAFVQAYEPLKDFSFLEVAGGGEEYTKSVVYALGPGPIAFMDIPNSRADVFVITPAFKLSLISEAQKKGLYSQQKLGTRMFDVITYPDSVQYENDGAVSKEYIFSVPQEFSDRIETYLVVQYFEDGDNKGFDENIKHWLSTLKI